MTTILDKVLAVIVAMLMIATAGFGIYAQHERAVGLSSKNAILKQQAADAAHDKQQAESDRDTALASAARATTARQAAETALASASAGQVAATTHAVKAHAAVVAASAASPAVKSLLDQELPGAVWSSVYSQ